MWQIYLRIQIEVFVLKYLRLILLCQMFYFIVHEQFIYYRLLSHLVIYTHNIITSHCTSQLNKGCMSLEYH